MLKAIHCFSDFVALKLLTHTLFTGCAESQQDESMNTNTLRITSQAALVALLFTLPFYAHAEWSGGVEGGTVLQGDSKGTKLRFKMTNNERPLNQEIYADWIRGESDSNSYEVGYKPKYWFGQTTYVFGEGSLYTSKELKIEQRRNLFAGLGIELINSKTQKLFAEIGAGQTSTPIEDPLPGVDATSEDTSSTVRIGAAQVLSELFKLELDGDYTTAGDVDQTTATAGIALRVPGGSIKYAYRLRSVTDGDADAVETKDSSVSYSYSF